VAYRAITPSKHQTRGKKMKTTKGTMRLTRNRKLYNQLKSRYKVGDGWVETEYSFTRATWCESNKPYGWSPFGRPLWDTDELDRYIADLAKWVEAKSFDNQQWIRSIAFLRERGIVIDG